MSLGMPWGGGDTVLGSSPGCSMTCRGISLQPGQRAEEGQCQEQSWGAQVSFEEGRTAWAGGKDARGICKAKGTRGKAKGQGKVSIRSADAVNEMQETCRF